MMTRRIVFAIFALIAIATAVSAVTDVGSALDGTGSWGTACYATLKSIVASAFLVLIAVRLDPRKQSRDPVAFVACAMAITPGFMLQPPGGDAATGWNVIAGEAVTVAGGLWMVFAIVFLGRCFGVLPEARGLVTRGPYRLVRHPLYLGELTAFGGLVIASPRALNVVAAAVFAVGQAIRMRLEERALAGEFPEYAAYAALTPRLIPLRGSIRRSRHAESLTGEVPVAEAAGAR
jgi:protein-S-isoprenylcysteine O-methyltransferase Ste14